MKGKKLYTPKEMREMASRFGRLTSNPKCLVVHQPSTEKSSKWHYCGEEESAVQKMLQQGANDREEIERIRKQKNKGKVYILTIFTHYEQTNERAIWSLAFADRETAEKFMRKQIRQDLKDNYEGDDEKHDYKKIVEKAIKDGGEEHDAFIDWTADRIYIYDIFETVTPS